MGNKIEMDRELLEIATKYLAGQADNFHLINGGKRSAAIDALVGELNQTLAAPVVERQEPFMYGIAQPDGKPHYSELCVSGEASDLESEVDSMNEGTDIGYRVVPLYTEQPAPVSLALPDGPLTDEGTIKKTGVEFKIGKGSEVTTGTIDIREGVTLTEVVDAVLEALYPMTTAAALVEVVTTGTYTVTPPTATPLQPVPRKHQPTLAYDGDKIIGQNWVDDDEQPWFRPYTNGQWQAWELKA